MTSGPITFAVQAHPESASAFVALAREVEAFGFDALYVPDHPGSTASPFVALAAVASATTSLRLGTCVVNAGATDPLRLAADAATLDLVSDGRAILGVGAGHTPAEWTMLGRPYPSPSARVAAMIEVVDTTVRLLRGEAVTWHGEHVRLDDAMLGWPRPPRTAVPLLIGGNGRRLIGYAAEVADIVELTGLGRTLDDGHLHETAWASTAIDERVGILRAAPARQRGLSALVQHVQVTGDRRGAAHELCSGLSAALSAGAAPTVEEILTSPHVMIGTDDEIVAQLIAQRARWGFDRYTVRAGVIHAVAPIMARLRS